MLFSIRVINVYTLGGEDGDGEWHSRPHPVLWTSLLVIDSVEQYYLVKQI